MGIFVAIAALVLAFVTPASGDTFDFTWRSTGSIPNTPSTAFDVGDRTTATLTALPGGTAGDPTPQLRIEWASPAGLATITVRQVGGGVMAIGGIPEFLPWPNTSGPAQWRLGASTFPGTYTWTGSFEHP